MSMYEPHNSTKTSTTSTDPPTECKLDAMTLLSCGGYEMGYSMMQKRVETVLFVGDEYDFVQVSSSFLNLEFSTIPEFVWKTHQNVIPLLKSDTPVDIIITRHDTNNEVMWEEITQFRRIRPETFIFSICSSIDSTKGVFSVSLNVRVFSWMGNPMLFVALVKLVEDSWNMNQDVENGPCGAILYVEDTCKYYSSHLPVVYESLLSRTHHATGLCTWHALTRRRCRPKIIFEATLSEALAVVDRLKGKLIGIITDIEYPLSNRKDESVCACTRKLMSCGRILKEECPSRSGLVLRDVVEKVVDFDHTHNPSPRIPVLFVSTTAEVKTEATKYPNCLFVEKSKTPLAPTLSMFLDRFVFLGPEFVAVDPSTCLPLPNTIPATDCLSLINLVGKIPMASLVFHASCNHFSNWLFGKGEFGVSLYLRDFESDSFGEDGTQLREFVVDALRQYEAERTMGLALNFSKALLGSTTGLLTFGVGSVGALAHRLIFLDGLRSRIERRIEEIVSGGAQSDICRPNDIQRRSRKRNKAGHTLRTARSLVLTTSVFREFVDTNRLNFFAQSDLSSAWTDSLISACFVGTRLNTAVENALSAFLVSVDKPVHIRASSVLEDSGVVDTTGLYSSFLVGNGGVGVAERVAIVSIAVRLVFASLFYQTTRAVLGSSGVSVGAEELAVVVSEVPGRVHSNSSLFYPDLSCTCHSLNFFPLPSSKGMKVTDGVTQMSVGLSPNLLNTSDSHHTTQNEFRFCPSEPGVSFLLSDADYFKATQQTITAMDLHADQSCTTHFLSLLDRLGRTTPTRTNPQNDATNRSMSPSMGRIQHISPPTARRDTVTPSFSPSQQRRHQMSRVSVSGMEVMESVGRDGEKGHSESSSSSESVSSFSTTLPPSSLVPVLHPTPTRFVYQSPPPMPHQNGSLCRGITASPLSIPPTPPPSSLSPPTLPFFLPPNLHPNTQSFLAHFGLPTFLTQNKISTITQDGVLERVTAEYQDWMEQRRNRYYKGIPAESSILLTFPGLLTTSHPLHLPAVVRGIVEETEDALKSPVCVTFCVDLTSTPASVVLVDVERENKERNDANCSSSLTLSSAFELDTSRVVVSGRKVLGVPQISSPLFLLVYPIRDVFDPLSSTQMAAEIKQVNQKCNETTENFVLIGFGRWGTRETSLGTPVAWNDITHAACLVETGFGKFRPEMSSGTHFLSHMMAAQVGWIGVDGKDGVEWSEDGEGVNWTWVEEKERAGCVVWEGKTIRVLDLRREEKKQTAVTVGEERKTIECLRVAIDAIHSCGRVVVDTTQVDLEIESHPESITICTTAQIPTNELE
ncbi:putative Pyruvate phosphate dikinase PEP/pyruvate-binding protein [Blattamonas nauphoetae]|uniref:Pyruvate phosphate dikinase PEP/pyruvate-binding protein n=1 Tax=Blattamonas nauphoetae TaxID=2049346 RepID=A0ABQ9X9J4_9EUKA|nr:putative Pyruvate phosphate dikinase PEP/pyruvate-binding protein [Blattamonas nauphoetae]